MDDDPTTTNDRGGLAVERVYDEGVDSGAVPSNAWTNAWTNETIAVNQYVRNFSRAVGGTAASMRARTPTPP